MSTTPNQHGGSRKGPGRPHAGRTARLNVLIQPTAREAFAEHAQAQGITLVQAVEAGAEKLRGKRHPAK